MPEVRLIDANALLRNNGLDNAVKYGNKDAEQQNKSYSTMMLYEIADMIEDAPTIDAELVRHGQWVLCEDQSGVDNDNNNYAYFCSQCHHQDVHSTNAKVNFCWNCGAKMDVGYINVITRESEP